MQHNAVEMGGKYLSPCVKCLNGRQQPLNDIRAHHICDGISSTYTKWIWHGELPQMSPIPWTEAVHVQVRDRIKDMLRDLGKEDFTQAHAPYYEKLETDSKKPLYLGCTTFTRLLRLLALVNLKARFGWSYKSFTELLLLLKNMLPEDNNLPKNHYEAKKKLCPVGLEYQKIYACHNDCILYRNQFAEMRNCPTCGVSRYKVKYDECSDDLAKVCEYLPIKTRFK